MDTGFGLQVLEPEQIIKNEAFYPDFSLVRFKRRFSLDADIHPELIVNYLIIAISRCNRGLQAQQREWVRQGARTLAEVKGAVIGGESIYTQLYLSAVQYAAYAEILSITERQVRTPLDAEERIDRAAIYRQKSAFALADLCGHHRIQVELI